MSWTLLIDNNIDILCQQDLRLFKWRLEDVSNKDDIRVWFNNSKFYIVCFFYCMRFRNTSDVHKYTYIYTHRLYTDTYINTYVLCRKRTRWNSGKRKWDRTHLTSIRTIEERVWLVNVGTYDNSVENRISGTFLIHQEK